MGRFIFQGLEQAKDPLVHVDGLTANANAARDVTHVTPQTRPLDRRVELTSAQGDADRGDGVGFVKSTTPTLNAKAITQRVGEFVAEGL